MSLLDKVSQQLAQEKAERLQRTLSRLAKEQMERKFKEKL